jgi:hypothetical protein
MAIAVLSTGLFEKLLMTVVFFFQKAQRSRLKRVIVPSFTGARETLITRLSPLEFSEVPLPP